MSKIIHGDSAEVLKQLPNNSIDLTVTSPPYDDLRSYNGFSFDFETIANELFRVTKEGGVVVWIVGDQCVNGSETLTSFKQALYFNSIGFRLHDTMIYEKNSSSFPAKRTGNRYTQIFEYMFVFSKGSPKCNLLCDKENKWAGHTNWGNNTQYDKEGNLVKTNNIKPVPSHSPRNNIWKYSVGFNKVKGHPAVFPEQLAQDHILSWSNEGDTVLDPFAGSGTTLRMAKKNNRNYIGIEISPEYVDLINSSLDWVKNDSATGTVQ
jgi:site-specific DNA-methyltransferase (adenine-specific)